LFSRALGGGGIPDYYFEGIEETRHKNRQQVLGERRKERNGTSFFRNSGTHRTK
jgi:hypothetical protein